MRLIFTVFLMAILLMEIALTGCSNDAEQNKASASESAEDQPQPRRPLDLSLPDDIGLEEWNAGELDNIRSSQFDAKELFEEKDDDSVSVSVTPSFNYNEDLERLGLEGGSVSVEVKTK